MTARATTYPTSDCPARRTEAIDEVIDGRHLVGVRLTHDGPCHFHDMTTEDVTYGRCCACGTLDLGVVDISTCEPRVV